MQDTNDGGFYFLVYPIDTEYERYELPDGHAQVVWPKTTSATASAVAALAEIGSSPSFIALDAGRAAQYLSAATNGWKFLTNAIAKYGKDGCYQKITTYGDEYQHDDELAWAAASLFAATGNATYKSNLFKWYANPADTNAHNGFRFLWVKDTNSLPSSSNLLVAIKYTPDTNNSYMNTNGSLEFRIFDSAGTKVVDTFDTNITTAAGAGKLKDFKLFLNHQYDDPQPGIPSTFNSIYALVGQCNETRQYGWHRCFGGYGCAVRDYAFAARSGRRLSSELDSNYLFQCENEITNRGADLRLWSTQNAYGTSLDPASKGHDGDTYNVGWYFAGDRTFDLAVADRIASDAGNTNSIIENFNYELGRNPVNVARLTGLGWSRQREVVDQYAQNNPSAVLPPSGIPLGNIVDHFEIPGGYAYGPLEALCFPFFGTGTNTYGLYDRWSQAYYVNSEFVHLNTARSLVSAAYLVTSQAIKTQAWRNASASVVFPSGLPAFSAKCTAQLSTTQDLAGAQIAWDPGSAPWNFLGQDPAFGTNYTFIPGSVGDGRTLQAEAVLPDGRRIFATTNFSVWDPVRGGTNFVNDGNTIALYHFDDTNSPFADATTNHFNLSASGNVSSTNNANWMMSPTGRVARFRNLGDQLTVTIPRLTFFDTNGNPTPVSIEFRIYPRGYKSPSSGYASIFQLNQDYYSYWSVQYALPDETPFIQASGGINLLSTAGWAQYLAANTWHAVKITTQPDGETQLLLDGNSDAGPISTVYFPHHDPSVMPPNDFNWVLAIGNFDGDIDEVRISKVLR